MKLGINLVCNGFAEESSLCNPDSTLRMINGLSFLVRMPGHGWCQIT